MICIDERFCLNSINNLFSDWLLINKEIKSIKENDNYFIELDQFYSYCQDKYLNKRTMNIMNNEKNIEKQNNLLEFNEIINNKNIDVNEEINKSRNVLLKKRKRQINNESDPFSISNNFINEEEEEEESIDNTNIDKDLFETIYKDKGFNHEQFQIFQNNQNVIHKEKIKQCPICFTKNNQSIFLGYSISKCNHIICNICWIRLLAKKDECPLCKRKVTFSELKKIILKKWVKK